MMGLLGTVTGMIGTFQSITLFGTGDPKLMAGGISMALITTVMGLIAALPLLLIHSLLHSRANVLINIIEQQSAGLIAIQAEQDEKPQAKNSTNKDQQQPMSQCA
jgi:biopolymer transport protein ExbB